VAASIIRCSPTARLIGLRRVRTFFMEAFLAGAVDEVRFAAMGQV
jgi:hypothetical protein